MSTMNGSLRFVGGRCNQAITPYVIFTLGGGPAWLVIRGIDHENSLSEVVVWLLVIDALAVMGD